MFVCTANVCRSPYMAFSFAQGLRDVEGAEDWTASSRGIQATEAVAMCALGAKLVGKDSPGSDFPATHRSSHLNLDELDDYPLILAAARSERSELARLRPDLRSRTFTLKEAVVLGRAPVRDEERGHEPSGRSTSLASYVQLLSRRRGTVTWPRPGRLRAPWLYSPDPRDIPDAHHDSAKSHLAALRDVRASARALSANVQDFLGVHLADVG